MIGEKLFEDWLAPLVKMDSTLLHFAAFIFYYHYFGTVKEVVDLFVIPAPMWITYVYGFVILLVSLVRISPHWQPLAALMIYLGSVWISVVYLSFFWLQVITPSWSELLVQLYYVLQALFSLFLVVLLLTQEEGSPFMVRPRLINFAGSLGTLGILGYLVGMTLILHRGFSIPPNEVMAQVNLYGVLGLEMLARLRRRRQGKESAV
ncbi:MAG: hypothetical protein ACP5GX_06250 [Anaerolineae bacterium]